MASDLIPGYLWGQDATVAYGVEGMEVGLHGWVLLVATVGFLGCLDSSILANKFCDKEGQCVKGYHCDPESFRCIPGELSSANSPQNPLNSDDPATSETDTASNPSDSPASPSDPSASDHQGDSTGAGLEEEDNIANVDPNDPAIVVPDPIIEFSFDKSPHPTVAPDEAAADPSMVLHPTGTAEGGHEFVNGAVCFTNGRLEADEQASKDLSQALVGAGSFALAFWASSSDLEQSSVILTLSSGISTRSFTLSQNKKELLLRLRSSVTDENGTTFPQSTEVFTETAKAHHIAIVYRGDTGESKLFVNANRVDRVFHLTAPDTPATLNWSVERERFGLGNEIGAELPWKGCIHKISIYNKSLDGKQLFKLFSQGM